VEEGHVTLAGRVDSRESKWLAEEVTRSVQGVQDVHNRLKVARW
jgi:osmotically-inducible protein OsmY